MAVLAEDLVERWPALRPFALVGAIGIVAGGMVAAVSRPTNFGTGSWLAAYLVLVVGVAQLIAASGQAWLAEEVPTVRARNGQLAAWNVGAAGVVAGTLVGSPALTTLGGLVTVVAVVLFLVGVRRVRDVPRWMPWAYRGLAWFVLASVPVGLLLAWVRHA